MNESDNNDQATKALALPYLLSIVLGCTSAWGIGSLLLGLNPLWMLLLAATFGALLGCSLGENVGEAIVLTVLIALLTYFFYHVGPQSPTFKAALVTGACGFCAGALVHGAWKEL